MENGPALIDGSRRSVSGRRFEPEAPSASASAAQCDISLCLPAQAENVVLVRHVVAALAETAGFEGSQLDDVRLAITEACTNVVRHAYPDRVGPLTIAARLAGVGLDITVTDEGTGLEPIADRPAGGLGLPLMAAVAQHFELDRGAGRGTRVRMSFALGR